MKIEKLMEIYEAPQVEIIEVEVEKGFAQSPYSVEFSSLEYSDKDGVL